MHTVSKLRVSNRDDQASSATFSSPGILTLNLSWSPRQGHGEKGILRAGDDSFLLSGSFLSSVGQWQQVRLGDGSAGALVVGTGFCGDTIGEAKQQHIPGYRRVSRISRDDTAIRNMKAL
jgi:hypothetical protein